MNLNRPIAIAMLLAMELSSGVAATAQEKDLRLQLTANPPMETVWAKPPDPVIPNEVDLRPGFTWITSLDDFRAVIKADGQKIRLKPGIYRADKLDPPLTMKRRHVVEGQQEDDDQQHIFAISGSNNNFDLRGVVIEIAAHSSCVMGLHGPCPKSATCRNWEGGNLWSTQELSIIPLRS
jgi:hypothetical protein